RRGGIEVAVASIHDGHRVRGDGERGVGVVDRAAAERVGGEGGRAVLEDYCAGGRADAGRSRGDGGGEDNRLAEHRRVGGGSQGRGGLGFVDLLGEGGRRVGVGSGVAGVGHGDGRGGC